MHFTLILSLATLSASAPIVKPKLNIPSWAKETGKYAGVAAIAASMGVGSYYGTKKVFGSKRNKEEPAVASTLSDDSTAEPTGPVPDFATEDINPLASQPIPDDLSFLQAPKAPSAPVDIATAAAVSSPVFPDLRTAIGAFNPLPSPPKDDLSPFAPKEAKLAEQESSSVETALPASVQETSDFNMETAAPQEISPIKEKETSTVGSPLAAAAEISPINEKETSSFGSPVAAAPQWTHFTDKTPASATPNDAPSTLGSAESKVDAAMLA
jgi:hypothetical protein